MISEAEKSRYRERQLSVKTMQSYMRVPKYSRTLRGVLKHTTPRRESAREGKDIVRK